MKILQSLVLTIFLPVSLTTLAQEPLPLDTTPEPELQVDLFARDGYKIDPLVCPFKGETDYEPGTIECGLLQVPENRENPNSRMIELHFVKPNSRWEEMTSSVIWKMRKTSTLVDWTMENEMTRSFI